MFDLSCIDVEDYLECLDIEQVRSDGTNVTFSCPLPAHPNGDRHPSARMNLDTTVWLCNSCKAKGDAVSLAAQILGIPPYRASRLLRERYDPGYADPYATSTLETVMRIRDRASRHDAERFAINNQPILDESVLEDFAVDWRAAFLGWRSGEGFFGTDYMFERYFHPLTLEAWQIGWDSFSQRITIPIRDWAGNLIGFKARVVDDRRPKYLILGDRDKKIYGWNPYQVSKVLFGAHRVSKRPSSLVVCEGELDTMAMWQRSEYPSVAINGSNPSTFHVDIIKNISDDVIIFFDSNSAGIEATHKLANILTNHMRVRVVGEHERDPASMTYAEIAAAISDAMPWTEYVIRSKLDEGERALHT